MLSFLPLSHVSSGWCVSVPAVRRQINYAGGIETVAADMREVNPS